MANRFGFNNGELDTICSILMNEPSLEEAFIFGSRAKGNYKSGSDVDIALKGAQLTLEKIIRLNYLLNEETTMPYKFDLVIYNNIQEVKLKEHIDRIGIRIIPQK